MKEIKFRAWDEKEKRFWYFDLQKTLERHLSYTGDWDFKIARGEKTQYIGLKDKNGKEIYEGDILSIDGYSYMEPEFSYIGEVKYANQCYCIDDKFDFCELTPIFDIYGSYTTIYEVIGNIYEDADMIENFYK
jgi:uncharacterized phage protein (TIGR01671 family)